jgi:hypothetical protein
LFFLFRIVEIAVPRCCCFGNHTGGGTFFFSVRLFFNERKEGEIEKNSSSSSLLSLLFSSSLSSSLASLAAARVGYLHSDGAARGCGRPYQALHAVAVEVERLFCVFLGFFLKERKKGRVFFSFLNAIHHPPSLSFSLSCFLPFSPSLFHYHLRQGQRHRVAGAPGAPEGR